jgi:hypothetical protein
MTNEELIAKAREFAREFREADPQFADPDRFAEVSLRESVTIEFTNPNRTDRLQICIDRQTGEFIQANYAPQDSHNTAKPIAAPTNDESD